MDLEVLKKELIRDEGLRLRVYTDSVGKLTVGVGRNISDKDFHQEEVQLMLENDIKESCAFLDENFPWWKDLDEVRQRVLVNMAFNLGSHLLGFKNTMALVQSGNFVSAANAMLKSLWATQVGVRAQRLARMMASGVAPDV